MSWNNIHHPCRSIWSNFFFFVSRVCVCLPWRKKKLIFRFYFWFIFIVRLFFFQRVCLFHCLVSNPRLSPPFNFVRWFVFFLNRKLLLNNYLSIPLPLPLVHESRLSVLNYFVTMLLAAIILHLMWRSDSSSFSFLFKWCDKLQWDEFAFLSFVYWETLTRNGTKCETRN